MSAIYKDEPDTGGGVRMHAMSGVLAQNWWAVALRGVVAILFGLIAFFVPVATILSMVIVFAAYMVVTGIFTIIAGVRAAQRRSRWALLVLEGLGSGLIKSTKRWRPQGRWRRDSSSPICHSELRSCGSP